MRHPSNGDRADVPLGYSLPVLLLGPIELIRRRDWPLLAVSVLLPVVGQISRIEWQLGMLLPRYTGRSSKSAD